MTVDSYSLAPSGAPPSPDRRLRLFISYSRDDSVFATELEGGLKLLGYDVFIDRQLSGGEAWKQSLANHIAQADTIVFVLSPSSLDSGMCQWEVDQATRLAKRILPVVIRDVGDAVVPERLSELNYIFFTPPNSFVAKLGELRAAIETDLDWLRELTRLTTRALEWDAAGRSEDRLLGGTALKSAQTWLGDRPRSAPPIPDMVLAFLKAAVEAETARGAREQAALEERERLLREREDAAARAFAEAARAEEAARTAETERHAREAALEQAERASAETAVSQRRAGRLLWGVAALVLLLLGGALWRARETEKREVLIYTSLAATAMNEDRHDRAMRFALQALPPPGCLFCAASTELEGRLAGAATLVRQQHVQKLVLTEGERVVATSFDARRVAIGGSNGLVRVVDPSNNREISRLEGHTRFVSDVVFSADRGKVLTVSFDTTARLWEVDSGRQLVGFMGQPGFVVSGAMSSDGRLVATGATDNTLRIWDASSGAQIAVLVHPDQVSAVAFSPDSTRLVSGGGDKKVRVWDVGSGRLVAEVDGHSNAIRRVVFSPDGKLLATAAADRTVRIHAADDFGLKSILIGHAGTVWSTDFSADGTLIATASFDRTVRVWHTATGREQVVLRGHQADVRQAVLAPDASTVVSVSQDGTVRHWSARSSAEVDALRGHDGRINSALFSSDGGSIVTAGEDGTVRVWRLGKPTMSVVMDGNGPAASAAIFSANADRIIADANIASVGVWDATSGRRIGDLGRHEGPVNRIVGSADGTRWASASAFSVRIWDATKMTLLKSLELDAGAWPSGLKALSFAPDGRTLLASSLAGQWSVWSTETWQPVRELSPPGLFVLSLGFNKSGSDVVIGRLDQTIGTYNYSTGREITTLHGHTDWVQSVSYNSDDRRIVSASDDGTVRIWDSLSGKEIARFKGHRGRVATAAFDRDARRVVSAGDDGVARIWDTSWFHVYGATLRNRVCAEKLIGAQEFTDEELADPILRGIDPKDPIARNPCERRGPLSLDYWTRLPGQVWRALRP